MIAPLPEFAVEESTHSLAAARRQAAREIAARGRRLLAALGISLLMWLAIGRVVAAMIGG